MTSKTILIFDLTQNEINNVSGGKPLPLLAVLIVGGIGSIVAKGLFSYGTAITFGIFAIQAFSSYLIVGSNFKASIRKGVHSELLGMMAALGLKLQRNDSNS